jgi:hypothetical protein
MTDEKYISEETFWNVINEIHEEIDSMNDVINEQDRQLNEQDEVINAAGKSTIKNLRQIGKIWKVIKDLTRS